MIQALSNNVVARPIPEPEDNTIKTVDGEHPYYAEILSIGAGVQKLDPTIKVGDYVFAAGRNEYRVINGHKYIILTYTQLRFTVDEEDLWAEFKTKEENIEIIKVDEEDL